MAASLKHPEAAAAPASTSATAQLELSRKPPSLGRDGSGQHVPWGRKLELRSALQRLITDHSCPSVTVMLLADLCVNTYPIAFILKVQK